MKNIQNISSECSLWQKFMKHRSTILLLLFMTIAIVLLLSGCDMGDSSIALAAVIAGTDGGKHIVDGPLYADRPNLALRPPKALAKHDC